MEDIKLKDKRNENRNEELDEYFKQLDIKFATLEKFGSSLLVIGYFLFIHGANIDILDSLDMNNTGETASSVTLLGAELILVGYALLFIVASDRLEEKKLQNDLLSQNTNLTPHENLYYAYFFSIIINMLRVHALSEIDKANKSGETFV